MRRAAPPLPSISIVTPNYNGVDYLADAIRSVSSQDYPRLQYVIADGASTDGSRMVIEQMRKHVDAVISEPDQGHADALNKGFAKTDGEIMGWINSDDILHPGCLDRIGRIFAAYPDVEWITGRPTAMNAQGEINYVGQARPWSRLRFLSGDHGWIQQESTFWRRSLWERAGGKLDESLQVANDFELWTRFFRHAHLYSADLMLGCFRVRPGQRSVEQWTQYQAEVDQVLRRELTELESPWRAAFGDALPDSPRSLTDEHKAMLESRLMAFDPPVIREADLRRCRPLVGGGPRFNSTFAPPEAVSDLSAFRNKHVGERCFILGNGPSLNETDLSLLKNETVFACNGAFLLFDQIDWRPTYYTCVDSQVLPDRASDIEAMLEDNPEIVAFFPAELQEHGGARGRFATRSYIKDGANRFFFNEEAGSSEHLPWGLFSTDADRHVVQPYTVAITMLQLAAYMGFSEIYLVGCDMRYTVPDDAVSGDPDTPNDPRLRSMSADPNHFDPDYFGPGRKWHLPQVAMMREHFRIASDALSQLGVTVKNATVGGDLEIFERISLEQVRSLPRPKRHVRPAHAAFSRPPAPRGPTARLAKFALRLVRNNRSALAGLSALVAAAAVATALAPHWAVWITLIALTGVFAGGLVALAMKTRRIVLHITQQLQLVQQDQARAEVARQRAELELQNLSHEVDQLRDHHPPEVEGEVSSRN